MIVRNIGGSFIAAFITVWLFLLMRYLILPHGEGPGAVEPGIPIELTREDRSEYSEPRKGKPLSRPVQQKTPPPPKFMTASRQNNGSPGLDIEVPEIDLGGDLIDVSAPTDRRAIPVVRIPPHYPRKPLSRDIEGWVLVEFTITIAGTVDDVTVVDAEPPNDFNKSATSAISRWKYQPKIVNGKPVAQYGMQELITYVIEE